ncbi:Putative amidase AmiD [bacterium HR39]|nr:Putative amidase AmiD [bacterium HR39]
MAERRQGNGADGRAAARAAVDLSRALAPLAAELPMEAVPGDHARALSDLAAAEVPPPGEPPAAPPPAEGLLACDLTEAARRLREGEVRAVELAEAALDALETTGRELGAVARLRREQALARADELDRMRAAGHVAGPLHGVPLAHKDMFDRAGEVAEFGSPRLFGGRRGGRTAQALARLDAAGALDLGRLSMVEIALGVTGHNLHTGTPKNPWDPARVTGGSSSGSAAAVAARCVFAALGSDTGGSIRIPAAFCNLVGLKPTFGLVGRSGAMPLSWSLDHVGPLCRSVRDAALLLEVLAGPDPDDPGSIDRRLPPATRHLRTDLRGVRILAVADVPGARVQGRVLARYEEALSVLRELGAAVESGVLPEADALQAGRRALLLAEAATIHRAALEERRDAFSPHTLARLLPGLVLDGTTYGTALRARAMLLRRFCREVFGRFDLVVTPTVPVPAPPAHVGEGHVGAAFVRLSNRIGALVGPFNYLGLPAVSVPMGFVGRAPVGLQMVGPPFADVAVLGAAHAFERATGHGGLAPPVRAA